MKPKNAAFSRTRYARLAIALAAVLLLGSGCGIKHISAVREAEEAFNRAAELENRQRLENDPVAAVLMDPAAGYRVAAEMMDRVIQQKSNDLKRDHLLCTARILQAMSLWRLGDHGRANDIAVHESNNGTCAGSLEAVPPRERALFRALPGLIRVDQANALVTNNTKSLDEYKDARQLIKDAIQNLDAAIAFLSHDHPARAYLLMSKLAALRVWRVSIEREELETKDPEMEKTDRETIRNLAQSTFNAYKEFLVKIVGRAEDDSTIKYWKDILGL